MCTHYLPNSFNPVRFFGTRSLAFDTCINPNVITTAFPFVQDSTILPRHTDLSLRSRGAVLHSQIKICADFVCMNLNFFWIIPPILSALYLGPPSKDNTKKDQATRAVMSTCIITRKKIRPLLVLKSDHFWLATGVASGYLKHPLWN